MIKKHRKVVMGLLLILAISVSALLAPWIAPKDPLAQNLELRLHAPEKSAWFGTDSLGRDLFSRVIYGARISLVVGLSAISIALFCGVLIGLHAGYYRGWLEHILMGGMDILMAFPSILLAIAIVAILGPSPKNATLAIGIVSIPLYARLTRGLVLSIKEKEFIQAAKSIGNSNQRILFAHILPNCLGALIIQIALGLGTAILDFAGLSFIGLGAQPPTPEWGSMLADTIHFMEKAPWTVIFPGVMIILTVLIFNLLGDGLRDLLDPRSSTT